MLGRRRNMDPKLSEFLFPFVIDIVSSLDLPIFFRKLFKCWNGDMEGFTSLEELLELCLLRELKTRKISFENDSHFLHFAVLFTGNCEQT